MEVSKDDVNLLNRTYGLSAGEESEGGAGSMRVNMLRVVRCTKGSSSRAAGSL